MGDIITVHKNAKTHGNAQKRGMKHLFNTIIYSALLSPHHLRGKGHKSLANCKILPQET